MEDLPRILDSNSPVKKRWGDVDQAKAIDSIKRALVQITTSYKENQVKINCDFRLCNIAQEEFRDDYHMF